MELPDIKEDENLIVNEEKDNIIKNINDKNNLNAENAIILKKSIKLKDIPYIIYPAFLSILFLIIYLIIFLAFSSKYKVTYIHEENAYDKPKKASNNYTTLKFENGLKLVLVQVDSEDDAGGAISFDYGYLDNKYDPGYIKLAFLSLISDDMTKNDTYINYFGKFKWDIGEFYSTFYFQILAGGFQEYLKLFSELIYFKDDDERFNHIKDKDLDPADNYEERKKHLLEFLVYGYKNSSDQEIIPQGDNNIKNGLNEDYSQIKNIMKNLISDFSKIKIVLYSHYKESLMIKYFLKSFSDIINRPKKNDTNQHQQNAYDIKEFTTNKIIYYNISSLEENYIEINYFLTNNVTHEKLIKDSEYLNYIIYILNQTDESSLYYQLNHNEANDISIKFLSCNYEIVLKSKIKFSILIKLNHYSYNHIKDIISKVYNYMNNIMLYINSDNNFNDDIRIEELDRITDQNFTFVEDPVDSNFFKKLANDLFYKDEKDYLLKQKWFTKKNFVDNIKEVKLYFNQLIIDNSVIILGFNNETKNKYNLEESDISFIFKNTKISTYFNLNYSENIISEHIKPTYDKNETLLNNPKKNEYISEYNSKDILEYNESDYDYFKNREYKKVGGGSNNNYLKIFLDKDTGFSIPRVVMTIYFFHPFFRSNYNDDSNKKEKDILFIDFLLYFYYVERAIREKLADAFRAGGNFFHMSFNEDTFYLNLYIYSDKFEKCANVIKDILYNETNIKTEIENKIEIYKDSALEHFSRLDNSRLTRYTFSEKLGKISYNNFPPIYNIYKLDKEYLKNIKFEDIEKSLNSMIYSIKYIYLYGYYNMTEAEKIYEIFDYSKNDFKSVFEKANYKDGQINENNFKEKVLERINIKESDEVKFETENKGTYRHIQFSQYSLKSSCLADLFIDILSNNETFQELDIQISTLKRNNIYMIYYFKDKLEITHDFIGDIFRILNGNEYIRKRVDVLGDRFYYKLKGYQKLNKIRHINMYDFAWSSAYDSVYNTRDSNDNLEFKFEKYEDYIEELKKYINSDKPHIDLKGQ